MPICKAKSSRTGRPCKKWAIEGGAVCEFHGGGAPQVKLAAKLRILDMVDPALAVILRSLKSKKTPAAVALKAATEVLDRAGIDLENKAEQGARMIVVEFVRPGVKE